MCLTTKDATIKTADKDIIVFKKLTWYRRASVFDHKYKLLIKEPIVQLRPINPSYGNSLILNIYTFNSGYHSHNNMNRDRTHIKCIKSNHIFVIPKGTKYVDGYFNSYTDIKNRVSETIVCIGHIYNPLTYINLALYLGIRKIFAK